MKFSKVFSYSFFVFSTVAVTLFSLDLLFKLMKFLNGYILDDSILARSEEHTSELQSP